MSTVTHNNPDALMNEREAASILCYSVRALQNWRHRGGGPKFVKVSSRSVRYRRCDLTQWVEDRIVANTSQAPKGCSDHNIRDT